MRNHALVGLGLAGLTLVEIARLRQQERHHRETKYLRFARMHTELLRDTAANPDLHEVLLPGLDAEDAARVMHANRWASLWSLMLRLGYQPRDSTAEVLKEFMVVETNRRFWELARDHRANTARDDHDTEFNRLANAAYNAAIKEASQTP